MCTVTKVILLLLTHRYFVDCFFVSSSPRVLLSVYYESKDENSKEFILDTLVPAVLYLQNHITLRMVPFGKATSINKGTGGFQCRRGPTECYGNMVQDCTLNLMHARSSLEKIDYVACEMESEAATRRDTQCIQRAGVSEEDIGVCLTSKHGLQLQLSSEYLTKLVKPKSLPVVTVNGEVQHFRNGDKTSKKDRLEELLANICAKIQQTKVCSKYFNSLALKQILNTNKN